MLKALPAQHDAAVVHIIYFPFIEVVVIIIIFNFNNCTNTFYNQV